MEQVRVLTYNVLTLADADGQRRQEVVRQALPGLAADVVALQEVDRKGDQAQYLLGPDYQVLYLPGSHQTTECLATRWPLGMVTELNRSLGPDVSAASALAAEVLLPPPLGPVLVVHHRGTYELHLEQVREQQVLATARFIEELVAGRPELPVVLLGDLNADPEAASVRFFRGKQSLDGTSVRYEDAWPAVHPELPGHTFTPANPLVRAGQMPLERGRRIDYILIRSRSHGPALEVADCHIVLDSAVDGVWPSDHYGVLADLRLPPHPPGTWSG